MQWAACKSRSTDPITPAELIAFCADELAQIPVSTNPQIIPAAPVVAPAARDADDSHAYATRDDGLASGIRKLNVNPRKRQRVDISDTFVRACRTENGNFVFPNDHAYAAQDVSNAQSLRMQTDAVPQCAPVKKDREQRDNVDYANSRRSKNSKVLGYEKLRKK